MLWREIQILQYSDNLAVIFKYYDLIVVLVQWYYRGAKYFNFLQGMPAAVVMLSGMHCGGLNKVVNPGAKKAVNSNVRNFKNRIFPLLDAS